MRFASLFRFLRPGPRPARAPRPRSARLSVERLDERCLLSAGLGANPALRDLAAALITTAGCDHGSEVPLKLRGSGQAVFAPDGLSFTFTASGQSTAQGHWTNEGKVEFTGPDPSNPGNILAQGVVVFTAANGDRLTATINGTFNPVTLVGHATFTWQQSVVLDGQTVSSTGRFADASGSAEFVAQNHPDGSFDFLTEGCISYHKK
jgi:hypothetical protein